MTRRSKPVRVLRFVLIVMCLSGVEGLVLRRGVAAAASFVQVNAATPQAPQNTVTVTYSAAQSAGNLNIVVVGWSDAVHVVASVTDSHGNIYASAVGPTVNAAGPASQSIYFAKNITAAAAGGNTVTVTFNGPVPYADIRILEYAGVDITAPVDVTAIGTGNSFTSSTAAVTTTNANDLLFAANVVGTLTTGPGTGFTNRIITTPDGDIAEDRLVTATGIYDATAFLNQASPWVMQLVAFRSAGSAPPPTDTTPPTAPANLTATPAGSTQINLAWTASTDNVGVTGYQVERCQGAGCSNFASIATPTATTLSDSGLAASTSYSYRVRATDAAGNLSSYSNIATAATPAPPVQTGTITFVQVNAATPQSPQTTVTVTYAAAQSAGNLNVVAVGWSDAIHSVASVTDSRANGYALAVGPTMNSGGGASQTIYYAKNITDAPAGGNTVTVTFNGPVPFADIRILEYAGADIVAPVDVTASGTGNSLTSSTAPVTTTNANDLLFAANCVDTLTTAPGGGFTSRIITTPDGDIAEDRLVTSTGSYGATATLSQTGQWVMQLVAFRVANSAPPTDSIPPTAPSNLTATPGTAQINLVWTASTDNVAVTGYQVERCQGAGCSNFAPIATPTATTFADSGLIASTSYSYRVRATDAAANLSPYSNTASATTPAPTDTTPPTAPSNLTATPGSTQINLAWTASTDNVGVTGYQVERCQGAGCSNFASIATPTATTFADTGLTASTNYSYRVRATDAAANLSSYSNTASTTTLAPPTPTGTISFVQVNAATPQTSQSTVTVTYAAAQSAGNLNIVVIGWSDGIHLVASVTDSASNSYAAAVGPTVNVAGAHSQAIYYARNIMAATAGGNTVTVTFNGPVPYADIRILEYAGADITAPVDVTATGTGNSLTSSTAAVTTTNGNNLLFAANCVGTLTTAAGGGFTSRIITSPDGNIAEDRLVTTTGSYDATATLSQAGPWVMQLVALRVASGAPPPTDTTPPTAPSNLTAIPGTTQINLAWTAATDNIGVTGYQVERCQGAGCSNFAWIATPTATTFSDSGLIASTSYSYRVRARDAAGNFSTYSNTVTAITTAATQSNPVVIENQQPGSSAWQLGSTFGRPYATDSGGQIKGYASAASVNKSGSITFYVSVNPAQTYTIDVYRIGWYQGLGGRLMQHIGPLNGIREATCPTNASTGMIECNWTPAYILATQTSWTSGIYLAVLKNAQGFYNYIVFTVRDDSRVAALLHQQPVTTYQAYNNYPDDKLTGKSLYELNSYGANTLAGTPRAVKVSFDRPYASQGAGHFIWLSEINFVRWAEKSGYDVTYSTDIDTHTNGARLLNYRGFLSLPHDEYWSKPMYDAAVAARDAGVNLAFFGANSIYWQIRFEPSSSGVANRVMVCYRSVTLDPIADPNLKTVKWRDSPLIRAEQTLVGVEFTDGPQHGSAPYVVTNSGNWVYAGTGFRDGDSLPGLVGYEADRLVSTNPQPIAVNGTYVLLSRSPYTGSNGADYSNSSIYQAPSGGWVFASGTMNWGGGLDDFYPEGRVTTVDARIQRSTKNVLDRFVGQ